PQPLPAAGKPLHARSGPQQPLDKCRAGGGQVLAAIQQEQQLLVAGEIDQPLDPRPRRGGPPPPRLPPTPRVATPPPAPDRGRAARPPPPATPRPASRPPPAWPAPPPGWSCRPPRARGWGPPG